MDRFSIAGSVALVTGASSGLGRHFAKLLAGAGANVVLAARRTDALKAAVEEITGSGGNAHAVAMDVTDTTLVAAGYGSAEAAFGPVEILVNNAGIAAEDEALELTEERWRAIIDTNLTGAFLVAREAARRMASSGGGTIINVASILGLRVISHSSAYNAAKAGLIHLTHSLALEWARYGIRVNAIAPGYVETDLNRDFLASDFGRAMIRRVPQRRLVSPEDLDGPLLLLASDASRAMTGSTLVVDGGHLHSSL